jgi:hypothetical protein
MPDLFCPLHGPYDASYGSCPYCGNAPQAPGSGGDAQTDIGFAPQSGQNQAPQGMPNQAWGGSEAPTDFGDMRPPMPVARQRQPQPPEEATSIGRQGRVGEVTELEFPPAGFLGILWVKTEARRGTIYKIENGSVIGRQTGAVVLDDPKVSNPHAKFTVENDEFIIWDFGSLNGTYVNGEKIRGAATLKENDEIKIGNFVFLLKVLPK